MRKDAVTTHASLSFTYKTAMRRLIVSIAAIALVFGCCFGQELVWSEEFDALDTNLWDFDVGGGGWDNKELQQYRRENVRVENGKLIIRIQEEADGNITSGRIFSKVDLLSRYQYGRNEASIMLPADMEHGLWPSFWMLGSNYKESIFPASGAIKIMQGGSGNAREQGLSMNSHVGSSIYWEADDGSTISGEHEIDTPYGLTSDFHTYVLQWTPERITTSVGGVAILSQDISSCDCDELHQEFIFVLNVAAGGTYPRISDKSEVLTSLPSQMEVDYIRFYNNSYTQRGFASSPTYANQPPPTYVDQFPRPTPEFSTPAPSPFPQPSMAPIFVAESPFADFVSEPTLPFPVFATHVPVTPLPTTPSPTTPEPTNSPTWTPTVAPSEPPSPGPTTAEPSSSPSTSEPTFQPSFSPTDKPSSSPSMNPSSSPTMTPTVPPLQRLTATGNTMALDNVDPLDPVETLTWQQVTRDHLVGEMGNILDAELVDLTVTLTDQNPPYSTRRRRNLLRRLQSNTQEITFDTAVTVKSAKDDLDANSFVDEAFETDDQKKAYLDGLRSSDSAFANVETLFMTQGESGVSQIIEAPATDGGGVNTSGVPFIVGIVVGAVVVAFVGLFVFSRRRRRKRQKRKSASGTAIRPPGASAKEAYPIEVDELDDSLYDFDLQVPTGRSTQDDTSGIFTSNSSVTMDYDDQVALQKASMYASPETGAPPPGVPAVTESYKRRPSGEFYRFTVDAPSGLLGMVLESSVEGTPSVYGIKNTSPLASDVQVGDRLVLVDGLDVSEMDATAVSRLIASKKMNKYRNLVFVRPNDQDESVDISVK